MSFYFDIPQVTRKTKTNFDCAKCGLRGKAKSPELKPFIGKDYDGLVILGQSPSKMDDENGVPFSDDRAKILKSTAIKLGINLSKEAAAFHAVSCPFMKHSETHFKCCNSIMESRLLELKPKLIICCGDSAFKFLFDLKEKHSITKLRNRLIPNFKYNCFVFPVYDPYDWKMYKRDRKTGRTTHDLDNYYLQAYKWDLERIYKLWNSSLHKRREVDKMLKARKILEGIEIKEITTLKEAQELFYNVNRMEEVSFDYETTNTKPFDHWFEIVYAAFSDGKTAWVFHEDFWKNPVMFIWFKKQIRLFLMNKEVKKIIQNDKFETLCSMFVYGINHIENAVCPMLATHVVDERKGCTSQDFQNLVRFGIPPYSDAIKKYITIDKKAENETEDNDELAGDEEIFNPVKVNRIREAKKEDMIKYNGLDVITCFHNWQVLKILLNQYPKAMENYEFLHNGHKLFATMSQRGIYIGNEEFNEFEQLISLNMKEIEEKIIHLPEVVDYNEFLEDKKVKKPDKNLKKLSKREVNLEENIKTISRQKLTRRLILV